MKDYAILLITPRLAIGGEELSTLSMARELKRRGYRVYWMSSRGPLLEELKDHQIKFVQGRVNGRSAASLIQGSHDIWKCISDRQIDIIHCQSVVPTIRSFYASRVLPLRPRIIWHDRGIHESSYPIVGRLFNYMTDFVIANSDYERKKLLRHGLWPGKVRTIHNCINMEFPREGPPDFDVSEQLGIRQSDYVIGTVRRLHPEKGGHHNLLRAAKRITKQIPTAKFLIVGGGPLEGELRCFAEGLGIRDRVIFTGFRRDVERLYPLMGVFVLPSTWEPFGNVLAEAMAFGKPVVATKVGGIPEIVTKKTGILVPPEDTDTLAEAILLLIRNPHVAMDMGKAGRRRAQDHFVAERVVDDVEEVYQHILSG